ncbi:MAG: hypothetical protein KDA80_01390 [Planctomycetaceae bacterium]|nr:hypothetical protein [Planctomycetaceae bacterium]
MVSRLSLGMCGIAVLALAVFLPSSGETSAEPSVRSQSLDVKPTEPDKFVGSQSCSSTSCHGSLSGLRDPKQIRFDEYHVWLSDPHARAYETLFAERSRHIFQNLGLLKDGGNVIPEQQDTFASTWRKCQACHDTPRSIEHPTTVFLNEGVGCEACHGPASRWLHRHYRSQWKSLSHQEKAEFGLINTADSQFAASRCGECHVGGPGREVGHDLIAAGHPALRFEWTWYRRRMPRHWRQAEADAALKTDPRGDWLTGQIAGLEATLDLMTTRFENAQSSDSPFDLADYSCFACHHDLESSTWRVDQELRTDRGTGNVLVPWSPWTASLLVELARRDNSDKAIAFAKSYDQLAALMESGLFLEDRSDEIATAIRGCKERLHAWSRQIQTNSSGVATRWLHALGRGQESKDVSISWNLATQLFLALASPYRDAPEDAPEELTQLRDLLSFPSKSDAIYESPFEFGKARNESPSRQEQAWSLIRNVAKWDRMTPSDWAEENSNSKNRD